ncbi:MAG: peptide chain release factor N(5)-glutamine methyltransferase [Gemmatimonadales bacterium]|jgi:release factor glutamine methyltransferase
MSRRPAEQAGDSDSNDATAPVSVRAVLQRGSEILARRSAASARREALFLLAGVLELTPGSLALQHDRPLQGSELAEYESRLARRLAGEPLQYVEGRAAFRDLWLQVDRSVLIPRPETEQLVECVLEWCRGREGLRGLDVGTGSGAIAISLVREGSFDRMVAVDISAEALKVAAINAREAGLERRLDLRCGSLFEAIEPEERFHVIVSNPPYIAEAEAATLAAEVREWEPSVALYAGPTGLEVIERIVAIAPDHLELGGLLALEIAPGVADATLASIRRSGRYVGERLERDLTGSDRIVLAERV